MINYVNPKCIYCCDNIGYKYKINFYKFFDSRKLPHKFRNNPFAIENIKNYLLLHNSSLDLISKKYDNCKDNLKFICKYHKEKGIQEKTLDKIIHRNQGCKYCAYERLGKRTRISTDMIIKRCNELEIKYIDRYSFNGETWIKYICTKHKNKGVQNISWYHLKTCSFGCPHCYGKYKTTEDFITEIKTINSDIKIIGEYKGSEIPIKCQCIKCGHIWSPIGRSLKYGQGCPMCKSSKGENEFLIFCNLIRLNLSLK